MVLVGVEAEGPQCSLGVGSGRGAAKGSGEHHGTGCRGLRHLCGGCVLCKADEVSHLAHSILLGAANHLHIDRDGLGLAGGISIGDGDVAKRVGCGAFVNTPHWRCHRQLRDLVRQLVRQAKAGRSHLAAALVELQAHRRRS